METSLFYQSKWGRISLLVKEGFYSSLRSFGIFHIILLLMTIVQPILLVFLFQGFSLETAIMSTAMTYSSNAGILFFVYGMAVAIYVMVWTHKIVHREMPLTITQLPATVLEKLFALGLLIVGYVVASEVLAGVLTQLTSLVAGSSVNWAGWIKVLPFSSFSSFESAWAILFIFFSALIFSLICLLCMIHFRRMLIGFLAAALLEVLLLILFAWLTVQTTNYLVATYGIEAFDSFQKTEIEGWMMTGILSTQVILSVILLWLGYYRFRTLQIKK